MDLDRLIEYLLNEFARIVTTTAPVGELSPASS